MAEYHFIGRGNKRGILYLRYLINNYGTFIASYDISEEYYEKEDFRMELIEFLLQNGATELHSYVESTIYFKTDKESPVSTWKKLIEDEFEDLYFILCRVFENNAAAYVRRMKERPDLDSNFQRKVNTAKLKLKKK